jgi:hypothetical protein
MILVCRRPLLEPFLYFQAHDPASFAYQSEDHVVHEGLYFFSSQTLDIKSFSLGCGSLQSRGLVDVLAAIQENAVERREDGAEEDDLLKDPLLHGRLLRVEHVLQGQMDHDDSNDVEKQLLLEWA